VHFEKSYLLNVEINSYLNQINNLNNIGRSYQRESEFLKATDYFFKALAIAQRIESSEHIALVATNITTAFSAQNNLTKAAEYAQMALKNAEIAKNPAHMSKALLQIGNIQMRLKDTAAARIYIKRAFEIAEGMNDKSAVAQVLTNMAIMEYPKYEKQIEVMLKAKEILDEVNPSSLVSLVNTHNLGDAYYNLALSSKSRDKESYFRKSELYLIEAKNLAVQTSNAEVLVNNNLAFARLEEAKGNYKSALAYYRQSTAISDSLFSQDKKNEIAGLEGKHNMAIKDSEIAVNKLMLSNQRKTQLGLIAGLLLAGVIGALLYRQARSRKKTNTTLMVLNNQLDEANKVKAKFFGILSHDLRSPVANLINFLQLQKNEPELLSAEQHANYQQKISASAEDLLSNMESMLIWSKEQMGNFKPQIRSVAVNDLFAYLQKFFPQNGNVKISFTHVPGLMVSSDENYLRIIMQNLTSNAIKAVDNAANGVIEWSARKEGDKTILVITDNGPGINEEQLKALYNGDNIGTNSRTGFGFHLIQDLAKAIQYKILVQSSPGTGTTFILSA
jgi:signal transduction histidine kinase